MDDLMDGHGRFIHAEGQVYEGTWKKDHAHGKGVLTYLDSARYVGS